MKYWRGYLVALLLFLGAWGLNLFASSHQALMDTFYPYVTRLLLDSLGQWSGGVDFCLWQLLLLAFVVAVLAAVVLMFILRWNPIQVAGWVLAVVALVNLLNTGLYGLNQYTGSIADDLRLPNEPYAVTDLQTAVTYFRDKANELSSAGKARLRILKPWQKRAADGFYVLVYERSASVLAGKPAAGEGAGLGGLLHRQGGHRRHRGPDRRSCRQSQCAPGYAALCHLPGDGPQNVHRHPGELRLCGISHLARPTRMPGSVTPDSWRPMTTASGLWKASAPAAPSRLSSR